MSIKKYISLIRAGILELLRFHVSMNVTVIGNLIYMVIVYYLWRAIYASVDNQTINGMTFQDTLIYLILATALYSFMDVRLVWNMGRDIQSGNIVCEVMKPVNFMYYQFFKYTGKWIVSFCVTFLPTFIVVMVLTRGTINFGRNLLFFFVSIMFSLVICFLLDFFVATICIYTESIWGINIMKEVVVSLLSGVTIPVAFFPDYLFRIIEILPFQAIYNTPVVLLLKCEMDIRSQVKYLLLQILWIVIMYIVTDLFWKRSFRRIMINGG